MRTFATVVLSFTPLFLSACTDLGQGPRYRIIDQPPPESLATISQGVCGYVHFWEGDFMPGPPPGHSGTITPVQRTVVVHMPTLLNGDVVQAGYGPFYSSISTQRVATISSNKNGFFETELPPGSYSIFVVEDSLYYANGFDGEGYILRFTVMQDSIVAMNINITYRAAF
ncbi:MAG: hypothetical protein MN733_36295 [Nitrososphaera sp.]|nr:hypothetical protein [Nitrososphaera sp.]